MSNKDGRSFCTSCGNLHMTINHSACAANVAAAFDADGTIPGCTAHRRDVLNARGQRMASFIACPCCDPATDEGR